MVGMASALLRAHVPEEGTSAPESLDGDGEARVRRMVDEHFDFIWRLLRRLGLRDDQAEDSAQQVFLVASRKLASIEPASERSFLFGTALRVAADLRRTAAYRREVAHADPAAHLTSDDRPDELLDRRRAREMLDRVLDAMDLDLRTVFVLFELEEMSTPDIAALLEIPVGTAASRLRRAREDFQDQVKRLQRATGGSR